MLRSRPHTEHTIRPTNGRPCRKPSPLATPAAPCCRALTAAHCPRCPLPTAPVTPAARATAAKKKLLAATTAAAENLVHAHGTAMAQPARDTQGAREPRHARGRPWMQGRRATRRVAAPAGHDADRSNVDAHDRVSDVGYRCAPAGLQEDLRRHLRPTPRAASATASTRSRGSERRVQTARVRGRG